MVEASVAVSSIATVLLVAVVPEELAVVATTLVASSVVLVFGEIVPKSYGLGNAETWSLTAAGPLRVVELLLFPLVAVFDALTRRLGGALGGQEDVERSYLED